MSVWCCPNIPLARRSRDGREESVEETDSTVSDRKHLEDRWREVGCPKCGSATRKLTMCHEINLCRHASEAAGERTEPKGAKPANPDRTESEREDRWRASVLACLFCANGSASSQTARYDSAKDADQPREGGEVREEPNRPHDAGQCHGKSHTDKISSKREKGASTCGDASRPEKQRWANCSGSAMHAKCQSQHREHVCADPPPATRL